jgi:hypothetical protein
MSQLFDEDGLRRDPQNVRRADQFRYHKPDVWYYEDRYGLHVVVHRKASNGDKEVSFVIPRSQVLRYARAAEEI